MSAWMSTSCVPLPLSDHIALPMYIRTVMSPEVGCIVDFLEAGSLQDADSDQDIASGTDNDSIFSKAMTWSPMYVQTGSLVGDAVDGNFCRDAEFTHFGYSPTRPLPKTRMCKLFLFSTCEKGSSCNYAHSSEELCQKNSMRASRRASRQWHPHH